MSEQTYFHDLLLALERILEEKEALERSLEEKEALECQLEKEERNNGN